MTSGRATVRAVTAADRDLLFKWANDPVVRASGFHPAAITLPEHQAWFDSVLADPKHRRLWIGRDGSDDIGLVRVDMTPDGLLEVGIALDAGSRGAGLSRPMLEAGLAAAAAAFPGRRVRAWIRATNAASLALFRGAGFEPPRRRPPAPQGAPGDVVVLERD